MAGQARALVSAQHTIEARIQQVSDWMDSGRTPDYHDSADRRPRPRVPLPRAARPCRATPGARSAPTRVPTVSFPIVLAHWATSKVDDLIVSLENWAQLRDRVTSLDRGRSIVCWGAGLKGRAVHSILKAAGFSVSAFIDAGRDREGSQWDGLPVRSPASLAVTSGRPFVVVTSLHSRQIARALAAIGYRRHRDWVVAIG
jgi:hypothetical protein